MNIPDEESYAMELFQRGQKSESIKHGGGQAVSFKDLRGNPKP